MITAAKSTPAESITDAITDAALRALSRAFAAPWAGEAPSTLDVVPDPRAGQAVSTLAVVNDLLFSLGQPTVTFASDEEPNLDGSARLLGFCRDRPPAASKPAEWITDVFVRVLARAFAADPSAIQALLGHRVPCNQVLADDPTIGVQPGTAYTLGTLGLLNGLLGELGQPPVATRYGGWPRADGSERLLGFRRHQPLTEDLQ